MVRWILLCLLLGASLSQADNVPASNLFDSVLRIEVATQEADYKTPWNAGQFGGGIGSGFIIGPNQILTNAHVVSNQQRILVTSRNSSRKYQARIRYIAHDCDLAILELEDFSDFAELPVFTLGTLPELESQVTVIGYPVGGQRISVTRGIVSRIDFQPYSHSRIDSHLVVQIDAAINPGNSGGPVLQDGKVIGVAFQGLRQADNTGYIIPVPVVARFLQDVADGSYDQYVELGITEFPLLNPAMRAGLGLDPNDDRGVLVANVIASSSADGVLKPGDVLFSIDNQPIDASGNITIDGERVTLNEIAERRFTGDQIAVRLLRGGTWLDDTITLKPLPPTRMYAVQYDVRPRYLVFAGLVFQPLDTNLIAANKLEDTTVRRLYTEYVPKGLFLKREDIVILSRIQPDVITSRLDIPSGLAVKTINGHEPTSLRHAHELLNPPEPPAFHIIELHGANRPIVIPSREVAAANERVMRNYNIQSLCHF